MDVLQKLFAQHFHSPAADVQPLQGELGGSGRRILRLSNATSSAIGVLYNVREENIAFLEFSRHFRTHGLPVPEIYEEDLSNGAYLEEDLGNTTLFEFLSKNRTGNSIAPQVIETYRKAVAVLPRFVTIFWPLIQTWESSIDSVAMRYAPAMGAKSLPLHCTVYGRGSGIL